MIRFCTSGTSSIRSSIPRSPRATITQSAAWMIASASSTAWGFSILAISGRSVCSRTSSTSSARRTNDSATRSTPIDSPKRSSSRSSSGIVGQRGQRAGHVQPLARGHGAAQLDLGVHLAAVADGGHPQAHRAVGQVDHVAGLDGLGQLRPGDRHPPGVALLVGAAHQRQLVAGLELGHAAAQRPDPQLRARAGPGGSPPARPARSAALAHPLGGGGLLLARAVGEVQPRHVHARLDHPGERSRRRRWPARSWPRSSCAVCAPSIRLIRRTPRRSRRGPGRAAWARCSASSSGDAHRSRCRAAPPSGRSRRRAHGVDRGHAEAGGQHAVEGGGGAAALDVAEDRHARLVARCAPRSPRSRSTRDAAEPGVAEGVRARARRATSPPSLRRGALGHDDDRERAAGVVAAPDPVAHLVHVERPLGHEDRVGAAGHAAVGGDPARVAAHHLHHHHPVVRLGGGVQPVDRVGGDLHGGVEAEGEVGARQVVVDRLRHARPRRCRARPSRRATPSVSSPPIAIRRVHAAGVAASPRSAPAPPSSLKGLVREVPRIVPPRCSRPRVLSRVSVAGVAVDHARPAVAEAEHLAVAAPRAGPPRGSRR